MKKNGKGVQFSDRELAGKVRDLGLNFLYKVLQDNYSDKDFQKQVLLKISSSLLPRLSEVSGADGGPVQVSLVKLFEGAEQLDINE